MRIARNQNISLLGKLAWDLVTKSNKLWVDILSKKYLKDGIIFLANGSRGSNTWHALLKALDHLKDGFSFKVGNGNSSFWFTLWALKQPLCDMVPYVDIHDLNHNIRDVPYDNEWNNRSVSWHIAREECVVQVLNVDGSVLRELHRAGYGGILQFHSWEFMCACFPW